jgi:hypothetical protein
MKATLQAGWCFTHQHLGSRSFRIRSERALEKGQLVPRRGRPGLADGAGLVRPGILSQQRQIQVIRGQGRCHVHVLVAIPSQLRPDRSEDTHAHVCGQGSTQCQAVLSSAVFVLRNAKCEGLVRLRHSPQQAAREHCSLRPSCLCSLLPVAKVTEAMLEEAASQHSIRERGS